MAEFEDKQAAGFEVAGGLGDKHGIKFVAFFASIESCCRLVVADFDWQRGSFAAADVRRIANN